MRGSPHTALGHSVDTCCVHRKESARAAVLKHLPQQNCNSSEVHQLTVGWGRVARPRPARQGPGRTLIVRTTASIAVRLLIDETAIPNVGGKIINKKRKRLKSAMTLRLRR